MGRYLRVLATTLAVLLALACASQKKKTAAPGPLPGKKVTTPKREEDAGRRYEKDEDGAPRMAANAKGIYNGGARAAASGNLAAAEQAFKRTLEVDSRAYLAAYNLGVIAERRGDNTEASSYYQQALAMYPAHISSLEAYTKLQIRGGNGGAALNMMAAKAQEYPKNLAILNLYADTLIIMEKYDKAIVTAKKVLRTDERNAEAMLRIGKANLRLGRYELAESVFQQVLKIFPDNAEVFFLRSEIYLRDGRKTAAMNDLKTAIEKRPDYVEAMNNLATIYLLSGNYADSVALLERAVRISPSWGRLQLNYGNALRGARRWKEAKAVLTKALALDSRLKGAIFNLGLLYYTADDFDNLDRMSRLREAKRLFAKYQAEMGSSLSRDDPVHKYLQEMQVAMEREQKRMERAKAREKQEAERAKQREAEEAEEAKKAAEASQQKAQQSVVEEGADDGDTEKEETKQDSTKPKEQEKKAHDDDGWF